MNTDLTSLRKASNEGREMELGKPASSLSRDSVRLQRTLFEFTGTCLPSMDGHHFQCTIGVFTTRCQPSKHVQNFPWTVFTLTGPSPPPASELSGTFRSCHLTTFTIAFPTIRMFLNNQASRDSSHVHHFVFSIFSIENLVITQIE
jgi:hypothetical protein